MPRPRRSQSQRAIEAYDHSGQERLNNPPVGLVSPDTDRDARLTNTIPAARRSDSPLESRCKGHGVRSHISKTVLPIVKIGPHARGQ